jgi:hypothetical protein
MIPKHAVENVAGSFAEHTHEFTNKKDKPIKAGRGVRPPRL